ncbi:MAG TPA: type 2 isopentenyl-diphosphate Delta-isomerase [Thermoanaerobaculia bacterium]|nr:type 2 isopentenyl-diphosphate Delta-isomerase [Thermoanaerobaculia bacterium]
MSAREAAMAPAPPAAEPAEERDRKAEHIRLALEPRMQLERGFFDDYRFEPEALPEIDLAEVDTGVEFLGRRLAAPLLISSMTGGTEMAGRINRNLAVGAERTGVALGLGSQRKALEDPVKADTFRVREVAPGVVLLANLGAVQLNYGMGVRECRQAVEMIGADALILHLNALQEALQPEGQGNFSGLLPKIGEVVREVGVPVVVKEIGCGITEATARALAAQGVRIVDTAGVGGTSWARIEAARAQDLEIGELFAGWGLPTPESIRQVRRVEGLTVIASGGIRNGLDAAKAIALGADLAGLAHPFLAPAMESAEQVAEKVRRTVRELRICMFCLGVKTIGELRTRKLVRGL